MLITASSSETDLFAAATQFYVRLRRVNGRVIDVQYMMENREYANYVIEYAQTIKDKELEKHLGKIREFYDPSESITDSEREAEQVANAKTSSAMMADTYKSNWFLG